LQFKVRELFQWCQISISGFHIFTVGLLGTLVVSLSLRLNLDLLDSETDTAKWIDRQTDRQTNI